MRRYASRLSFSISIDGFRALHDACRVQYDGSGSYDLAIAGVKHYSNFYQSMGSKMTIAPGNVRYVFEACRQLVADGYEDVNLNCAVAKRDRAGRTGIPESELDMKRLQIFARRAPPALCLPPPARAGARG